MGLVLDDTICDAFCVLDGMGGVWSTHVEMHFCPQRELRYILCPRRDMRVWSTHVEMHFIYFLV